MSGRPPPEVDTWGLGPYTSNVARQTAGFYQRSSTH